MFVEFTTTVTHRVELGGEHGIESTSHDVCINGALAPELPQVLIMAIAKVGLERALEAVSNQEPDIREVDPITDDEEDNS